MLWEDGGDVGGWRHLEVRWQFRQEEGGDAALGQEEGGGARLLDTTLQGAGLELSSVKEKIRERDLETVFYKQTCFSETDILDEKCSRPPKTDLSF